MAPHIPNVLRRAVWQRRMLFRGIPIPRASWQLIVTASVIALTTAALPAASAALAEPAASAAHAFLAVAPPPTGWSTIFSDDFNGSAGSGIDSQWMYDTGLGRISALARSRR
jgi:hypothetical protein